MSKALIDKAIWILIGCAWVSFLIDVTMQQVARVW
jgi:hypothetical protein